MLVVGFVLHFVSANAASAAMPANGTLWSCAVGADQAMVSAADQAVHAIETTSEDCQKGDCSGLTCHCTCHGLAAALTVTYPSLPARASSTRRVLGHSVFTSATLLPPVPPPQA